MTRSEFALLQEVQQEQACFLPEGLQDGANYHLAEAGKFKRAAALLRRDRCAWDEYFGQGGQKLRWDGSPMPKALRDRYCLPEPQVPTERLSIPPTAKPAASNGDTDVLRCLSNALNLNPDQRKVFALIARWERVSPADLCRDALLVIMEGSFDDMGSFARKDCDNLEEAAWARKFFNQVKPLFSKGGAR